MFNKRDRNEVRKIRHERVRKKISGTPERPRLCVYRSNRHIVAQIIDDIAGNTLAAASTVEKEIASQVAECDKKGAAKIVGKIVAERGPVFFKQYRVLPRRLQRRRAETLAF